MASQNNKNKLGEEPINSLLRKFAIPSIISMLVMALYNIVDQFFIGQKIGEYGNAATNIVFPLTTSCVAIALLCGIGGAANFNLSMGRGQKDKAMKFAGNALSVMVTLGVILSVMVQIFLPFLLDIFGCPTNVYDYAVEYTRITAIGFMFGIFTAGASNLIRADGSPKYSMLCNIVGAAVNMILDPILIFGFDLDMKGAAIATIVGQMVSAGVAFAYLLRFKSGKIEKSHLKISLNCVSRIFALGATPFLNQVAMMIVQIVLNMSLSYYGKRSEYGDSIPLACAGIVMKINQMYFSIIIGLSQGLQPLVSFNYGAKKYKRVKQAYLYAATAGCVASVVAFIIFQIFPRQLISAFGNGSSELYYDFGIKYFKIFLFATFINFMQPLSSNFFTAIGKPKRGIFLSLTRQIIFLLPLVVVFPLFFGIEGITFTAPVADLAAGLASLLMVSYEFKVINAMIKENSLDKTAI